MPSRSCRPCRRRSTTGIDTRRVFADLAESLEHGSLPSFRFHEHDCASPLPRAGQWLDASAYVNHVELVRKARSAEMPDSFWTDPLMYQGGSDVTLGPRQAVRARSEETASISRPRSRSSPAMCPWASIPTRRLAPYPPGHARKRRELAESDCEGIGERLWIRSIKALIGLLARRGDAR
jgi:2-keto-4-pentenoate hydratase/2-oxohepta-3-ene-1,7-dioic acid hydratase in catechol pathway